MNEWSVHYLKPLHQEYGGVDQHVEHYRQATRACASEHGLPLSDIDRALRDAASRHGWQPFYQNDGVHLTAEANRVVAEAVFQQIRELYRRTKRLMGLNAP